MTGPNTVPCSVCSGQSVTPVCWRCNGSGRIMADAPDASETAEVFVGLRCTRCGHAWVPRRGTNPEGPSQCPRCHSGFWDKPRVRPVKTPARWQGEGEPPEVEP